MIRGSDGLDYEDLTQRLLGNPASTKRNIWIERLQAQGRSKAFIKAWIEAYEGFDGRTGPKGGKVNSFQNGISALRAAERAEAHVAGLAADGYYDLPTPPP